MQLLAYIASALIGISLGLIGGGGSILTVPVLVYLFGFDPVLATSYSLFIVGSTSLAGAVQNFRRGLVSVRTALLFALSSVSTVFLIRRFILPLIPGTFFRIGSFTVTHNLLTMTLFAFLMVVAGTAMIRGGKIDPEGRISKKNPNLTSLLFFGTVIGIATGLLGAGGGFLLIPILVMLVGLSMKEAVGTSLLIIALNSLIGFTGDLGHFQISWFFLLKITAITITGVFTGGLINNRIKGLKLKRGFGWFVLITGTGIIIKEILLK
ncbi:sulfite exporter TauE/SafE family protein [Mucilaginibacter aquariorum]|uniref:Probable membrane transporter protein n=1 Tax=Mucilaginibacter aquariorum TaxID=2967225 RepID=A0ABT1T4F9_9SPHI|nr:sulfite exporter TauE/SafE family protein [Mucilaginibacter aquariorum]MCQ6959151.1 sulfite exporter TauE/SafE family protein [Mucilaginibacter aquariorum]